MTGPAGPLEHRTITSSIEVPDRPKTSSSPSPSPSRSPYPNQNPPKKSRRASLPFAFPPLFQPNTSSTSLVHSTAEGKPIPLDDDTTAHRTSALRELNITYPSRSRYAKSTTTQNSKYSQPVLVRTYSGAGKKRSGASRIPAASGRGEVNPARGTSIVSEPASSVRRVVTFKSPLGSQQYGLLSMARSKTKKGGASRDSAVKLPPIEAYSFKNMMDKLDAEGGDSNISADLDRIAEICARSRYSLSNQYEVHVAPHGSGAAFLASASSRRQHITGPSIQTVTSDDERNSRRHRSRKSIGGKRRSIVIGTLETIISSSSNSSEAGTSKKKSAAEITEEVRGRASRMAHDQVSPPDPQNVPCDGSEATGGERKLARKKSSSFATAMMENTRQSPSQNDIGSPRNSASTLLSPPAQPQTSTSHLEVRTEPEDAGKNQSIKMESQSEQQAHHLTLAGDEDSSPAPKSLLGGLGGWMPTWTFPPVMALSSASAQGGASPSHAEGSLRDLLKTTNDTKSKGKSVERQIQQD